MKMRLTCAALALVVCAGQTAFGALMDITRPGDAIELISGFNQNDGNNGDPPGNEGVEHAIDDIGQKAWALLEIHPGNNVRNEIAEKRVITLAHDAEAVDCARSL